MTALGLLTVANVAVYVVAAILHLGVEIPVGPFTLAFPDAIPAATVVEGVIAMGLAWAAVAVFARGRSALRTIWAAYLVALVGTLFGLTVALMRGLQGPDIWVHFIMLAGLAGGFALLYGARAPRDRVGN
jgi:hypothetical protein